MLFNRRANITCKYTNIHILFVSQWWVHAFFVTRLSQYMTAANVLYPILALSDAQIFTTHEPLETV